MSQVHFRLQTLMRLVQQKATNLEQRTAVILSWCEYALALVWNERVEDCLF